VRRERAVWLAAAALGVIATILTWIFLVEGRDAEHSPPALESRAESNEERSQEALAPRRAPGETPAAAENAPSTLPAVEAPELRREETGIARSWRGKTVDESGTSVPLARLVVASADGRSVATRGSSDAEGRFSIERLSGDGALGAFAPGHEPAAARKLALQDEPGADEEIRLVLRRGGGVMRGVVRDASGAPVVAAVAAKLRGAGGSPEPSTRYARALAVHGESSTDGSFALEGVPRAELWIGARATGFAPLWIPAQVAANGEGFVELTLSAPVEIRGTLRAEDATALERGQIFALPRTFPDESFEIASTTSKPDGSYRLQGLQPGEIRLRASAGGCASQEVLRHANAGEVLEWNVILRKGPRIRGRLYDARGVAAEGWKITPRDPRQSTNPSPAWTDPEGRFEISGVREHGYSLLIQAPGTGQAIPRCAFDDVRPSEDEQNFRVPESAEHFAVVRGRVIDATGRLLANAPKLRLVSERSGTESPSWEASTGSFLSPPLPPGAYALRVQVEGAAELVRRVLLTGEDVDLGTLQISAGAELRVAIKDSTQREQVFVFLHDDAQRARWMAKAEGDELVFPRVPAGDYVLRVEPRPYSQDGQRRYRALCAVDRDVHLAEGEERLETLELFAGRRVLLEIEAPEDVRSAELEVRNASGALLRATRVERYGEESLTTELSLPLGRMRATARWSGGAADADLELEAGDAPHGETLRAGR
jgi:hypothetical protein